MLKNHGFYCDECGREIPDTLLWIELSGTIRLKTEKGYDYKAVRMDFCDPFCAKSWIEKSMKDGIDGNAVIPNSNKKKAKK